MTSSHPIACSLAANDLQQRLADLRALGADALPRVERTGAGSARLAFASKPGVRGRLAAVVAAESRCCPFLTFHLHPASAGDGGAHILTIAAPDADAARLTLDELLAAFAGDHGDGRAVDPS